MAHTIRRFLPPAPPTEREPAVAASAPDDLTPPAGWRAPAPASRSRAAYRRTDGAEVFFDRRSRADDPLDSLRPGWNWLARRPEGTMLGHRVAAPVEDVAEEGGLFLPRKFKTAAEAMRALDRDAPAHAGTTPTTPDPVADALGGALAGLEAQGGDLLGPDGALVPRVGVSWAEVRLEAPLTVGVLPATGPGGRPRGALVGAGETPPGLTVVAVGEEDVHALRRLADKLVAAPSASRAQALREFLDFLAAHTAPTGPAPNAPKPRKRIALKPSAPARAVA